MKKSSLNRREYVAPSMKVYKTGVHCMLANSITSVAPTGDLQMENLGDGSTTIPWDWD